MAILPAVRLSDRAAVGAAVFAAGRLVPVRRTMRWSRDPDPDGLLARPAPGFSGRPRHFPLNLIRP